MLISSATWGVQYMLSRLYARLDKHMWDYAIKDGTKRLATVGSPIVCVMVMCYQCWEEKAIIPGDVQLGCGRREFQQVSWFRTNQVTLRNNKIMVRCGSFLDDLRHVCDHCSQPDHQYRIIICTLCQSTQAGSVSVSLALGCLSDKEGTILCPSCGRDSWRHSTLWKDNKLNQSFKCQMWLLSCVAVS